MLALTVSIVASLRNPLPDDEAKDLDDVMAAASVEGGIDVAVDRDGDAGKDRIDTTVRSDDGDPVGSGSAHEAR